LYVLYFILLDKWACFTRARNMTLQCGIVTITTESSKNCAITLSRMNVSGHVGHTTLLNNLLLHAF